MLVMFINWMVLGPPDASWWAWAEHIAADLSVLGLMALVAVGTSRVRNSWVSLLARTRSSSSVRRIAESVRDQVQTVERPHLAAAHGAGFLAAAGAFALVGEMTDRPVLMLGAVLGGFVGAQVAVMTLLRPRAEAALRRALEAARVGLTESDRFALSEELGLARE